MHVVVVMVAQCEILSALECIVGRIAVIYPCPPIPNKIIFIILGFLLNGLGSAPVFIPGLILLSKNISKIDSNIDELTANDISSAINN